MSADNREVASMTKIYASLNALIILIEESP